MHVDVTGHAGARGFADVHSQVDAIGTVEFAQDAFQPLRQAPSSLALRVVKVWIIRQRAHTAQPWRGRRYMEKR